MTEATRAQCEVCGESLDNGRLLCLGCSKQEWRKRKTDLQQCYLAVSAADERAEASLAALGHSESFSKLKQLQDMQYNVHVSRRRVSELKAYLDSLREKNASCLLSLLLDVFV